MLQQATWGPFIDILADLNVNCIRIYQVRCVPTCNQ